MKYICTSFTEMQLIMGESCGYVYDPEKGDELNNVPTGVVFDDLPDAWMCPLCYAGKNLFDPLD